MRQARILICVIAVSAIGISAQTAKAPSKKALEHFAEGQRHESQGQGRQAIEEYTAAIRISSDYYAAFYRRGKLYLDLGEKKNAILDLNAAIQLQPDDSQALLLRANIYRAMGQPSGAIGDL